MRIASYELAKVAMPYHVGAKIIGELDASQRWIVTGRLPRKGYIDVAETLEDLIPRSMPFSEAYARVLDEEIVTRLADLAKGHGVPIDDLSSDTLIDASTIGENPRHSWERMVMQRFTLELQLILPRLPSGAADELLKKLTATLAPFAKQAKRSGAAQFFKDREEEETRALRHIFSTKLAGWKPPGHARKKRKIAREVL